MWVADGGTEHTMADKPRKKRSKTQLFWGRTAGLDAPVRVSALVFAAAAIIAMSFCQLGFWPMGVIDGKSVYLMLLLAPLAMGSMAFGPRTGMLLGLFAGAVVFGHAVFFPLDFYEVYFMSVLNTFVLLTCFGAVGGWLFSRVLRSNPTGFARLGAIAGVSLVLSFAASGLVVANTVLMYGGLENLDAIREYLINSPLGVVVQALIDAALMTLLCSMADKALSVLEVRRGDRTLLSTFRNWMFLVSAVVFMVASSVIFSATTAQAQASANENMLSEIRYLKERIAIEDEEDIVNLLNGYEVPLDGYVMITDKESTILATDDPDRYPKGAKLISLLGYDVGKNEDESLEEWVRSNFGEIVESDDMATLQAADKNGAISMEFAFLAVGEYDDGYVAVLRTPDMVFMNRFDTMLASTSLALLLLASIVAVATVLLRQVVVRRIDETNDSLGKITNGNLNERVHITDSREFISLSTGINTTVAALKDTIDEVEQRNAQDLATAKTIQESALPREFPPFPQIDKFDIYASMKTAKEVGGDFYDFFLIGDENDKLGFVMADVSGKGIPAALFMMTAKTQIQNHMEAGLPVGEAIDAANHQLCIGNDANMFVTMWVGVLEYETGLLTFANAGHNPPLLLRDGSWEWVNDVSGMPLGLFDGIPYDSHTRQLEPGDMLYLYTDGVTEAMNARDELFGEERLLATLESYADMNPRSVGVGVRRALTDFTLDAEQSDDITMLILKYGVPPEKKAVMVLPADVKQLIHVCNFIHEELRRRNAPASARNPLDIAAEELFVNVCHYAYPDATPENPGEVRISFEYEDVPPALTVQIADDGVPYNPLAKPDAVTPDDIMEVPIGGLGILMAKKSVDEMSYERVGDSNVLTFKKGW